MNLKWQLWQGNWWLRCNGRWLGYYPASLFSASGLRDQAEKVAWYGEIVDAVPTPARPARTWATVTGPMRAGSIRHT